MRHDIDHLSVTGPAGAVGKPPQLLCWNSNRFATDASFAREHRPVELGQRKHPHGVDSAFRLVVHTTQQNAALSQKRFRVHQHQIDNRLSTLRTFEPIYPPDCINMVWEPVCPACRVRCKVVDVGSINSVKLRFPKYRRTHDQKSTIVALQRRASVREHHDSRYRAYPHDFDSRSPADNSLGWQSEAVAYRLETEKASIGIGFRKEALVLEG